MATITLVQPALTTVDHIVMIRAQPGNIQLANLTGGPIQFRCTNPLPTVRAAKSVEITYDATVHDGPQHTIQVSSVMG